jgi:ribosomal protein S18 acetylase RimI-like enzyme
VLTLVRPDAAAEAALVALLSRAFDADPVINWVLRQDGARAAAFEWLFRLSLDMAPEVYTTADRRGVALWTPPGWGRLDWLRHLPRAPGFVRAVGLRRLGRVARAVAALERSHPGRPHYYLSYLAVDPPLQGRGIGSALLRHVLDRCDAEGIAAYLENSNPRNTPLYERHGFRAIERHSLGGGDGPPLLLMWREPVR